MRKKGTQILLLCTFIGGMALLVICINHFMTKKLPPVSCTCEEVVNELHDSSWDVCFTIESPEKGSGFFLSPLYSTAVCFRKKGNQQIINKVRNTKKWLRDYAYIHDEKTEREALQVLADFRQEEDGVKDEKNIYSTVEMLEYEYVVSLAYIKGDRKNVSREAYFFVYERSEKKIVYLCKLMLNEEYCFGFSGKMEVREFSVER